MNRTRVKSIPLREVIQDMAQEWGVEVHEDCDECWLEIPKNLGEGIIRGINFSGGLGYIIYDCLFYEDMEIRFTIKEIHPLKFLYCVEGHFFYNFEEDEENIYEITKFQSAITASTYQHGNVLTFKANVKTCIASLEILRHEFIQNIECDLEKMDEQLRSLFTDIKAAERFYSQVHYSLHLDELFTQMSKLEGTGVVMKFFLQAKTYEMLAAQIMLFEDDSRTESDQIYLRRHDLEAVKKAIKFIEENLKQTKSVADIAKEVGLNESKLQLGFKQYKGTTVNAYIAELRLESAKRLLLSTDMNISEIVYQLGLSNRGYFAKKFKERFGMTPTEYKQSHS
ncbi:helix-turn-helix transcriptional regulator [Owenweeksia hongkongensis]|uniref:helix-turn-helix transcriptional regulator n=1 Tax=Owenweeksia hongkongensis TaxID=253245 RepID=UPI003A8E8E6D